MITRHDKKRIAIFGAGQAGRMLRTWIPAEYELCGFIDNAPALEGKLLDGLLVRTLEQGLLDDPDLIWIAVLNREAEAAIRKQIREAGYDGEIRAVSEISSLIDIRLSTLRLIAERLAPLSAGAAVAELGVYRGAFAAEINRVFPNRDLYLFDTFSGFDERDIRAEGADSERHRDFSDTSVELVRNILPHPEKAVFVKGYFPESLALIGGGEDIKYAFVNLDPDLYQPVLEGLHYFFPRLVPGGMIMVHDYNSMQFPGVRRAVDHFAESHRFTVIPLPDLHGTAVIVRD